MFGGEQEGQEVETPALVRTLLEKVQKGEELEPKQWQVLADYAQNMARGGAQTEEAAPFEENIN